MRKRSARVKFSSQVFTAPPRPAGSPSTPGFILLGVLLVAGFAWLAYNAYRASDTSIQDSSHIADRFLYDLGAAKYDDAAALLSSPARANNDAKSLQETMESLTKRDGPLLESECTFSQPRNIGGLQTCKLVYLLRFQSGQAHASLILVRGYRAWMIDSIAFD